MNKVMLSLNFMHCMERLATQIYLTQMGAFNDTLTLQKLSDASQNERGHVQILQANIKRLNGSIYPFGWLFQLAGVMLGYATRMSGKGNLFKADTFIETRAVKDYASFLKNVPFDPGTVASIRAVIADEEEHIINWKKARESLTRIQPAIN